MIVHVDVPAVEIARPVLHVRFDGPRRAHLGTLAAWLPGPAGPRHVVVGVLAASHQVVVDGTVVETVTCDDPTGAPVAPGTVIELPHLRFRSALEQLGTVQFERAVDDLVVACGDGVTALAARFPNNDRAVTAVVVDVRGWHTTHTYPRPDGGGVLVTTETELT